MVKSMLKSLELASTSHSVLRAIQCFETVSVGQGHVSVVTAEKAERTSIIIRKGVFQKALSAIFGYLATPTTAKSYG